MRRVEKAVGENKRLIASEMGKSMVYKSPFWSSKFRRRFRWFVRSNADHTRRGGSAEILLFLFFGFRRRLVVGTINQGQSGVLDARS
jgi:hypothetical protein